MPFVPGNPIISQYPFSKKIYIPSFTVPRGNNPFRCIDCNWVSAIFPCIIQRISFFIDKSLLHNRTVAAISVSKDSVKASSL